jgi:hypothetical protein
MLTGLRQLQFLGFLPVSVGFLRNSQILSPAWSGSDQALCYSRGSRRECRDGSRTARTAIGRFREETTVYREIIMPTYSDEKRRVIRKLADYLRLMGLRTHKIAKSSCFVTFGESPPEDDGSKTLKSSVGIVAGCSSSCSSNTEDGFLGDTTPVDGGQQGPSNRFYQFAFNRDCFYVDIPRNTLFVDEAHRIISERHGFCWARSRLDLRWVSANWDDVLEWNPLQKVYLYRDEESAAEDMAFVLFDVWKFPVDWQWYVRAGTFKDKGCDFDWSKPLE